MAKKTKADKATLDADVAVAESGFKYVEGEGGRFNRERVEEGFTLSSQIKQLTVRLDAIKDEIRQAAANEKHTLVLPGIGKMTVSAPRSGSTTEILVLNEPILAANPKLQSMLLEKGIITKDVKITKPASAAVSFSENV